MSLPRQHGEVATLTAVVAGLATVLVAVVLQFTGVTSLVAGGGVALLLAVLVVLTHRDRSGALLRPSGLLVVALSLALVFTLAINLRSGGGNQQVFAEYGLTKRLILPVILLLFGVFALVVWTRGRPARVPVWWSTLAAVLVLSTAASFLRPRQPLVPDEAAQGATLLAGALLFSWLGMQTQRWTPRERHALLLVLFTGAALSGVLVFSLTPFAPLLTPAVFASVYLALTAPRHRMVYLVIASALGVLLVRLLVLLDENTPGGLSIAIIGEVVGCALLLALYLTPRGIRPALTLTAAVVGAVALVRTRLTDLLLGDWRQFTDVTLSHRGYETQQVLNLLTESPVTLAVGLGPSGTVDLSTSPDAATPEASGRLLSAVGDVHLLSSWLLLKLGVAGLLWSGLLAAAVVRLTLDLLHAPEAQWDRVLLLFVVAGIISSLTAATNLLTNPLPMLLIGVLFARQRGRQGSDVPPGTALPAPHVSAAPPRPRRTEVTRPNTAEGDADRDTIAMEARG